MHPVVKLAKETVERYIRSGERPALPGELTPEMKAKAGVFVSIKKNGELRGCIGTFSPTTENVACEIMQNAVSAATQDPRFPAVSASELEELEYSVDVLSPPERIEGTDGLDPGRYGVIVKKGNRRGLLLPDLDGIDTVGQQLGTAASKAGIFSMDGVELFRFEVRRYR